MNWLTRKPLFENLFYLGALAMNVGVFVLMGWPFTLIMGGATLVILALLNHPDWMEDDADADL